MTTQADFRKEIDLIPIFGKLCLLNNGTTKWTAEYFMHLARSHIWATQFITLSCADDSMGARDDLLNTLVETFLIRYPALWWVSIPEDRAVTLKQYFDKLLAIPAKDHVLSKVLGDVPWIELAEKEALARVAEKGARTGDYSLVIE